MKLFFTVAILMASVIRVMSAIAQPGEGQSPGGPGHLRRYETDDQFK
jgi:hypothetical protein